MPVQAPDTTPKPDTRTQIMRANFMAMWKNGYQGVRADKVVQELNITKGALYHYFPTKQALGYAIVDEMMVPNYLATWGMLITGQGQAMDRLKHFVAHQYARITEENVQYGCPLNNLTQEMSPLDEGFRLRLSHAIGRMHSMAAALLLDGQRDGSIKSTVMPEEAAWLLLASVEGAFGMAKVRNNKEVFMQVMNPYLDMVAP